MLRRSRCGAGTRLAYSTFLFVCCAHEKWPAVVNCTFLVLRTKKCLAVRSLTFCFAKSLTLFASQKVVYARLVALRATFFNGFLYFLMHTPSHCDIVLKTTKKQAKIRGKVIYHPRFFVFALKCKKCKCKSTEGRLMMNACSHQSTPGRFSASHFLVPRTKNQAAWGLLCDASHQLCLSTFLACFLCVFFTKTHENLLE